MSIETDPFEVSKASVARGLALAAGKEPKAPAAPKTAKKVVAAWQKGRPGQYSTSPARETVERARYRAVAVGKSAEVAKNDYCSPGSTQVSKSGGCGIHCSHCKGGCDNCSRCKGVSKAFGNGMKQGMALQRVAGMRVTKPPKPPVTAPKVQAAWQKGTKAAVPGTKPAMSTPGADATSAARGLFKPKKPKMAGVFGKSDPFEIAKGNLTRSDASVGRHVSTQLFAPVHGLVAGKKGHKLRAAGNEIGGAVGGTVAGGAIGALATRGSVGGRAAGQLAGQVAGVMAGVNRAQNKGHYKAQVKKNDPFDLEKADAQHLKHTLLYDERMPASTNIFAGKNKKLARTIAKPTAVGEAAGLAAGAGAGAAYGAARGKGKLGPTLVGGVAGQITGGSIGRSKGIRRAEREGLYPKKKD